MRMRVLVFFLLAALLSGGCATGAGTKKSQDEKIKTQTADLDRDGKPEIIETEDRLDTEGISIVTVKKPIKGKDTETIDSFSVEGKIRKLDFIELYYDRRKQIVVFFDGKDGASGIMIYQLINYKLSEVFVASSKYGIDAELKGVLPRIRIGGPPRQGADSPNRIPEWESWAWTGDKFIRE